MARSRRLGRTPDEYPDTPLGNALRAASTAQRAALQEATGLDALGLLRRVGRARHCSIVPWVRAEVMRVLRLDADPIPGLPEGWNRPGTHQQ